MIMNKRLSLGVSVRLVSSVRSMNPETTYRSKLKKIMTVLPLVKVKSLHVHIHCVYEWWLFSRRRGQLASKEWGEGQMPPPSLPKKKLAMIFDLEKILLNHYQTFVNVVPELLLVWVCIISLRVLKAWGNH